MVTRLERQFTCSRLLSIEEELIVGGCLFELERSFDKGGWSEREAQLMQGVSGAFGNTGQFRPSPCRAILNGFGRKGAIEERLGVEALQFGIDSVEHHRGLHHHRTGIEKPFDACGLGRKGHDGKRQRNEGKESGFHIIS